MDKSDLLTSAEKVVNTFHNMVGNVAAADTDSAAANIFELTLAINELAEEVAKGKALMEKFKVMAEAFKTNIATAADPPAQESEEDSIKRMKAELSRMVSDMAAVNTPSK